MFGAMEPDELTKKMRALVAQSRGLADMITSPSAKESLLQMAAEGEGDNSKLGDEAARQAEG